jgi:hypothetical protein
LISIKDADQNAARGTQATVKTAVSSRKIPLGPLCKALLVGEGGADEIRAG